MRVVMTGGTSGIGLEALRTMLDRGVKMPVLGVRDASRLPADLKGKVECRSLDLNSLASVRTFCASLDVQPIDSATRIALARAFDQARTLNGSAQKASWLFGHSTTQLHAATFRGCPNSLMRQSATHTRRFAFRNSAGTSSVCLHSRLAFRFRAP